jgi:hypothetical protein
MVFKIISCAIFICFLLRGVFFMDPDFGWHLRMGELILRSGIPATDPFSYTMPSFPVISHEWLTDAFLFTLYSPIGKVGLAFIFSCVATAALILCIDKKGRYSYVPFLLAGMTLLPFFGIRPQVLSWLFFSVLLKIISVSKQAPKVRYSLPILFLLWVNIHGSFAIGIAVLLLECVVALWQQKRVSSVYLIVLLLSFAATLVNPYGYRVWWEVWLSISDPSLRWFVNEWHPALIFPLPVMWFYICFASVLVIICRKKLSLFELLLFFGLLCAGISSIRHIPLWAIAALPLSMKAIDAFLADVRRNKGATLRLKKAVYMGIILLACVCMLQLWLVSQMTNDTREEKFYPKKAIAFLKQHPSPGQIFSAYSWGGYLLWKVPEKKTFVDGRMPSWRYHYSHTGETDYAFRDFRDILRGALPFAKTAKIYNIDTVLLPVTNRASDKKIFQNVNEGKFAFFYMVLQIDWYNDLRVELQEEGWRRAYQDDVAIVYRRE